MRSYELVRYATCHAETTFAPRNQPPGAPGSRILDISWWITGVLPNCRVTHTKMKRHSGHDTPPQFGASSKTRAASNVLHDTTSRPLGNARNTRNTLFHRSLAHITSCRNAESRMTTTLHSRLSARQGAIPGIDSPAARIPRFIPPQAGAQARVAQRSPHPGPLHAGGPPRRRPRQPAVTTPAGTPRSAPSTRSAQAATASRRSSSNPPPTN